MVPGTDAVLILEDLSCDFLTTDGILYAVNGVNLKVGHGEIHGLVGESGCGKSVSSRAALGLLDRKHSRVRGRALFGAGDLLRTSEDELRTIRGRRVSMIFQDPLNSLSPLETIGSQIEEAMSNHFDYGKDELRRRRDALLAKVGLHPDTANQYPFELSGGMQQRVMIAQGISCDPELLIADEPTTALDVTIQAQVLALLRELRRDMGLSVLLITHNFAVVAETCDRVSVMYAGIIVETAAARELIDHPAHPYSRALIDCIPRLRRDGVRAGALPSIPGSPPRLHEKLKGCPFAPRCPDADGVCVQAIPPRVSVGEGHDVYCHHVVSEGGAS